MHDTSTHSKVVHTGGSGFATQALTYYIYRSLLLSSYKEANIEKVLLEKRDYLFFEKRNTT